MTMKMTKRDLKVMMKECLVELIQEGAFNIVAIQQSPSAPMLQREHQQQMPSSMMANPQIMNMMGRRQPQQQQSNNEVANFARQAAAQYAAQMGSTDPAQMNMYASIFEDTIQNTMANQAMSTESFEGKEMINEAYGANEVKQEVKNLQAVGDVSRWAKIAFSPAKKRLPGQPLGMDEEDRG